MTTKTTYRFALAVAVGTALFLLWGMGALGIIGVEGDRADLLYLAVLAIVRRAVRGVGMAVPLCRGAAGPGPRPTPRLTGTPTECLRPLSHLAGKEETEGLPEGPTAVGRDPPASRWVE